MNKKSKISSKKEKQELEPKQRKIMLIMAYAIFFLVVTGIILSILSYFNKI